MNTPRELSLAEITGSPLVEIVQEFRHDAKAGLNFASNFFRLACGLVFRLPPDEDFSFLSAEPPAEAEPIVHSLLDRVYGQRIVDAFWEPPVIMEAPYLLLENGYMVSETACAPEGIELGVTIFKPGEVDVAKLVRFAR